MNSLFDDCLRNKRIWRFSEAGALMPKELDAAENDFAEARGSLSRGNYKWATIQCYYSMFHSARALLYAEGYRERSHYCLIVALRALYVEKGRLEVRLVEALQRAKSLREEADYNNDWSEDAAKALCASAEELLRAAEASVRSEGTTD